MQSKVLTATFLACMAVGSTVSAQSWDGMYLGGHLGGASLSGDYTAFTPRNGFAGFPLSELDGSGLVGGIHAGRNWDMGGYVLGIEGSLSAGGVSEDSTQSPTQGSVPVFTRDLDGMATLTGRVGVPAGSALLYARAGAAVGRFTAGHDQNGTWLEETDTRTGWVVGIGAEGPISDNVTWRIDLTHADFGDFRTDLVSPATDIWVTQDATVQTLTVGFNIHFD